MTASYANLSSQAAVQHVAVTANQLHHFVGLHTAYYRRGHAHNAFKSRRQLTRGPFVRIQIPIAFRFRSTTEDGHLATEPFDAP